MAYWGKFLGPLRQSPTGMSSTYSSISHLRRFFYAVLEPPMTRMKILEPVQPNYLSKFQQGLGTQRALWQKFCFSGKRLRIGSMLSVSAVFGSYICWPHVAYAMDGHDFLVHGHYGEPLDASDVEEDLSALWRFARKFWMPLFFILTVLTHLSDPVSIIALKVVLFLLCTKPSPFSVYVSIDELCHQSMHREPFFYKPKSMYAKKIEIEDYKLLCLARVEVGDQKFTLIGILGGWWTLPSLPSREAFSLLRHKARKHQ